MPFKLFESDVGDMIYCYVHSHISDLFIMFICRVQDLHGLSGKAFISDLHLPNLLVFSAKTDFHDHYLYKAGHIILQDKVEPACHLTKGDYCVSVISYLVT